MGTRPWRTVMSGLAVSAVVVAGTVVTGGPASALVSLSEVGTVGGGLHAEMYPSGLETAPDGTIVIADTGNNQVAKYTPDGTQLWRVGTVGAGVGEFENPRDIGVSANGDIFVSDSRNSRVVKLNSAGAWISSYAGPAGDLMSFQLGVSVSGPGGAERVYVADTGRNKVRVLDTAFNQLSVISPNGVCNDLTGVRDADADAAGNVYVAGYKTNEILVFGPDGTCRYKFGSTGSGNGQFRTPYGVDVAFDPVLDNELVYVADGLNDRVQVFTKNGTFVSAFGHFAEPKVVGTFTTMRRVAVTRNGSGDVWAADLWGNRIERWRRTPSGYEYAATIGAVMPEPTSTAVFQEPRGLAWDTEGRLNVADTVHHQIVKFTPDGTLDGTCGQRAAEGSQLGQFNWPRGVAIDPVTDDMWVADTKQHKLQVLHQDCRTGFSLGYGNATTKLNGFNWPYSVAIRASDRTAWVADNQNNRIVSYDVATRLPVTAYGTKGGGVGRLNLPSGVAVNPANGHILVADTANDRIVELQDNGGSNITQVAAYTAGNTLLRPQGVAADAQGRIFVADTGNDRLVSLSAAGAVEATKTGMHGPANVAVGPDGNVYVSDTYNDVVKVFSVTPVPPDVTAPTASVAAPRPDQQLSMNAPVTMSGNVADDRGVTAAYVSVKDRGTGRYLRPNGTLAPGFAWLPASVTAPGSTSTTWTLTVTLPPGSYQAQVRVDDAAGNMNAPKPVVNFAVIAGSVDTTAPDAAFTSPTTAQVFAPGDVPITGTTTDNVGVVSVKVLIKRNGTTPVQWWNGASWGTNKVFLTAAVAMPGAQSTTWSYTFAAPSGAGSVFASVTPADAAGNVDGVPATVNFKIVG